MDKSIVKKAKSGSLATNISIIDAIERQRPGFMDAVNSNTITDWSAQNGLPAAQVMNSVRILKDLEATKLQEVGTIASKRFTAQELRDLNNDIGSPENKAVFAEALRIWEGMSYNAN